MHTSTILLASQDFDSLGVRSVKLFDDVHVTNSAMQSGALGLVGMVTEHLARPCPITRQTRAQWSRMRGRHHLALGGSIVQQLPKCGHIASPNPLILVA